MSSPISYSYHRLLLLLLILLLLLLLLLLLKTNVLLLPPTLVVRMMAVHANLFFSDGREALLSGLLIAPFARSHEKKKNETEEPCTRHS